MSNQVLAPFADACELVGPLLLSVKLPGRPGAVQHALDQPFAVVGRDAQTDLRLEAAQVSPLHSYFQVIAGRLFVVDLGSRTGTHAKGGLLRAGWLADREPLRIGPFWVRWLSTGPIRLPGDGERFNPLHGTPPAKPLVPVALEFLNGQRNQPCWPVDRALTLIGTASPCKVCLESPSVAAFHCSLVRTAAGLWVVDLLSRTGVRVNGVRVPCARLEDDDRLQIGEFVIRVCYPRAEADGEPPANGVKAAVPPAPLPESVASNGHKALGPWPALSPATPPLPATAASPLLPSLRATAIAPPDSAARTELTDSILVPLITQFGAMQEQMADQFRQTMVMMFQMFSALHKDQMAFIHEEMDRLQQLTQELHRLQVEAARHAPTGKPATGEQPAGGGINLASSAGSAAPASGGVPPAQQPLPTVPGPCPPLQQRAATPVERPKIPDAQAGEDIHGWLCRRMAQVQEERQTRWQKILGLLTGKRPEAD